MKIKVRTNQGVLDAELIRNNAKTVIVKLPDGREIKRHKAKHVLSANEYPCTTTSEVRG